MVQTEEESQFRKIYTVACNDLNMHTRTTTCMHGWPTACSAKPFHATCGSLAKGHAEQCQVPVHGQVCLLRGALLNSVIDRKLSILAFVVERHHQRPWCQATCLPYFQSCTIFNLLNAVVGCLLSLLALLWTHVNRCHGLFFRYSHVLCLGPRLGFPLALTAAVTPAGRVVASAPSAPQAGTTFCPLPGPGGIP